MNWITITNEEEVLDISKSANYAIIYKHSPRCMTSLMAYRQLKSEVSAANDIDVPIYMVDVIKNRQESQFVAKTFEIRHESPQVLVVKNGVCVYNTSHEAISLKAMLNHIGQEA
ncbi:bacillithiol system redox-active protein YtxJ [Dyadobacter sp. NIV53]|uniref:bacillithiol system redox-active protein YtxJ n=1 Tax=Dyadobacter sp. NIV53 TaxID=2861765 RepID=UPI001C8807AD|nr:bacillithiol system redox-active protein YtxJ [Dyadobacter sp. NIV53]